VQIDHCKKSACYELLSRDSGLDKRNNLENIGMYGNIILEWIWKK
jgi:hypothetical protein